MPPWANITDITDAVCAVLIDRGCDLIIVELYNLNLATRAGAEVSDQLASADLSTPRR